MKSFIVLVAGAALLASAQLPAATPSSALQDGPALSETGWCASVYGALARARTRKTKSPKRVIEAAGFLAIDFAKRRAAIDAKLAKTDAFAVTYYQQAYEEAFDAVGYAEADGTALPSAADSLVTDALTRARACDRTHGLQPMLLDRVFASPSPPVEPYSCAVNYYTLAMGMKDNPPALNQVRGRMAAAMTRFQPAVGGDDEAWRNRVRERMQADSQERNRAVGAKQVTPEQLFAHSQACDRMLATP
jgi:hypothetical protein